MKKNTYLVQTRFTVKGTFRLQASSAAQAREYAEQHCGLSLTAGLYSSLPAQEVDWEFPAQPTKETISIHMD